MPHSEKLGFQHFGRILQLLDEIGYFSAAIDGFYAETDGIFALHFDAGNRAFGIALYVVDQHHRVVHPVDVVTG